MQLPGDVEGSLPDSSDTKALLCVLPALISWNARNHGIPDSQNDWVGRDLKDQTKPLRPGSVSGHQIPGIAGHKFLPIPFGLAVFSRNSFQMYPEGFGLFLDQSDQYPDGPSGAGIN